MFLFFQRRPSTVLELPVPLYDVTADFRPQSRGGVKEDVVGHGPGGDHVRPQSDRRLAPVPQTKFF